MNFLSLNKSLVEFEKGFYLFGFYLISLVLLFSGISKIIDPQPLTETILKIDRFAKSINLIGNNFIIVLATLLPVIETLKSLQFFPVDLLIVLATLLPIIEIILGGMLILKTNVKITLISSTILFTMFFVFAVYGHAIGLDNDCGCFGSLYESNFGLKMIIRNFSLSFLSFTLLVAMLKNNCKLPGRV